MPTKRALIDPTTLGHLIDLHIGDMREVNRAPRRSKAFTLQALKKKLGNDASERQKPLAHRTAKTRLITSRRKNLSYDDQVVMNRFVQTLSLERQV